MTISFLFVSAQQVPVLPYSTRLDRFFLLCFFMCFITFFYNLFSHLVVERFFKHYSEARARNKGRVQWCWTTPESTLEVRLPAAATAAATPAGAAVVTVAAPPGSPEKKPEAPAAKKAGYFCGVLGENFQDIWDTRFAFTMLTVFIISTCIILAGPSSLLV